MEEVGSSRRQSTPSTPSIHQAQYKHAFISAIFIRDSQQFLPCIFYRARLHRLPFGLTYIFLLVNRRFLGSQRFSSQQVNALAFFAVSQEVPQTVSFSPHVFNSITFPSSTPISNSHLFETASSRILVPHSSFCRSCALHSISLASIAKVRVFVFRHPSAPTHSLSAPLRSTFHQVFDIFCR